MLYLGTRMESVWFERGSVRLHGMQAGPSNGPLVILLHGFPEYWYGWRHQIPALAEAGFCVVALDQRGYNLSAKPERLVEYSAEHIVSDVIEVADQLGRSRFCVVGHDWGGAIAWLLGALRPDRVQRMAILNVPHPKVFRDRVRSHFSQRKKSAYIGFFRFPVVPEMALSTFHHALLKMSMRHSSRPGTFSKEDFAEYRKAWTQPGAMKGMLNPYRAAFLSQDREWAQRRFVPISNTITVPTLLLWGQQDKFLEYETAEQSLAFCESGRLRTFETATHWLQHEEVDEVNFELIHFFGRK